VSVDASIRVALGCFSLDVELQVADGATLGTFNTGAGPFCLAFDGANIWVTNYYSGTVSKR